MSLSYSRLDYYERVFDQKVETFIQCHINAFKYFKGISKYLYNQFAHYCGFNPLPCRVRQPQEKGKVESGIKYIKYNFFAGSKFVDYIDTERQL